MFSLSLCPECSSFSIVLSASDDTFITPVQREGEAKAGRDESLQEGIDDSARVPSGIVILPNDRNFWATYQAASYCVFRAIPNVGAGGTSLQLRLRVPTPHVTLFIADSSRSINKAAESRNGTTRRLNPERDCLKLATSSRLRGSVEDASGPREG